LRSGPKLGNTPNDVLTASVLLGQTQLALLHLVSRMGTSLKDLKCYHLLIGLVFGLLCFGCAVKVFVAIRTAVPFPNFTKHNQTASTPCPGSSPCQVANQTPRPNPTLGTINVDTGKTYISYYITDAYGVVGCTHDPNHVSSENCRSTLFKTTFVAGSLKPAQLANGSKAGEIMISGQDAGNNNKAVSWVSLQNDYKDDDVTWIQVQ
jgi:hypothetical protein